MGSGWKPNKISPPPAGELLSQRTLAFGAVALVLILVGMGIDYHLAIKGVEESNLPHDQKRQFLEIWSPFYLKAPFWSGVSKEVGVAIIIALTVAFLLERSFRVEQYNYSKNLLESVNQNLFNAVMGLKVPESISQAAIDIALSNPVIRPSLRLRYELIEIDDEDIDDDLKQKYIKLICNFHYTIKNVSSSYVEHDFKVFFPKTDVAELEDLCRVSSVSIGDLTLSAEDIAAADAALADTDFEKRVSRKITLGPGEVKEIFTSQVLIKERSDSETWASFLATEDFALTVEVRVPGLKWNVDALHSGKLRPIDGPQEGPRRTGTCNFQASGALLPFQGVLLWWRPETVQTPAEAPEAAE